MEKRSWHIIKNVSFCVPRNEQSHMVLEYIFFRVNYSHNLASWPHLKSLYLQLSLLMHWALDAHPIISRTITLQDDPFIDKESYTQYFISTTSITELHIGAV